MATWVELSKYKQYTVRSDGVVFLEGEQQESGTVFPAINVANGSVALLPGAYDQLLAVKAEMDSETIAGWAKVQGPLFDHEEIRHQKRVLEFYSNEFRNVVTGPGGLASQFEQLANAITMKVQKTQDGKLVVVGMGMAIDPESGQTEVGFLADVFRVYNQETDELEHVFVIDTEEKRLFFNGDMHADGSITARMLATDAVQSRNWGDHTGSYIDLANGRVWLGGALNPGLRYTDEDGLILSRPLVVSPSGTMTHVPVMRGAYLPDSIYYQGDHVTYGGSNWRYINSEPSAGNTPQAGQYWQLYVEKGAPGQDGAQGPKGDKGDTGSQGVQGPPGQDGQTLYTWVKYADTPTSGMSDSPAGKTYIGLAYNKTTPTESSSYGDYSWSLIKGADGADGIPGPPGSDGQSLYTWVRYADSPTSGMSSSPTGKKYMGIAYNKTSATPSNNYGDYSWSLVEGPQGPKGDTGAQGIQGPKGADGQSQWTHIRYSVNANGNPMTTTPGASTKYIGIAVTTSSTAPAGYASYSWAKFAGEDGEDGQQGIPGQKGADGITHYTWIRYADTPTMGMSNNPAGKAYIGIAYNKTTATESDTYSDYAWSLYKGEKGDKGDPGERGLQGLQGPEGNQGIPGVPGEDGVSSYTHIAYANNDTGTLDFSHDNPDRKYIGMYVDQNEQSSSSPSAYHWSLIKGADGAQGIPGAPGDDGLTSYLHIAYANNATGTIGFSTTDSAEKTYIGQYTDHAASDSTDPSKYKWSLIKGDKGLPGTITKPENADLWHFDQSLLSTGGLGPTSGAAKIADGGKFGGSVVVETSLVYHAGVGAAYTISVYRASSTWNDYASQTWDELSDKTWIDLANYRQYVVRSDGAKFLEGERNDGVNTSWLSVSNGQITLSPGNYDELFVVREVVSDQEIKDWYEVNSPIFDAADKAFAGERGEDGKQGKSVAELSVYRRSASQPDVPLGGRFNFSTQSLSPPPGWGTSIPAGNDPAWLSVGLAAIIGDVGIAHDIAWSTPAKAFEDGAHGQAVNMIFRRSVDQPQKPSQSPGVPSGWWDDAGDVPQGDGLMWSSVGTKPSPSDDWTWQTPIQVEGEDGAPGADGADGKDGAPGKDGKDGERGDPGPGILYQGPWENGKQYYGNGIRTDVVEGTDGNVYICRVNHTSQVDRRPISGSNHEDYWIDFGATFESVATKLLLTDDANITKTLNIGSGIGDNTAGMSGEGEGLDAVRIWAGGERESAPFRVMQDGSVFASKGKFSGDITGASGTFSGDLSAKSVNYGNLNVAYAKVTSAKCLYDTYTTSRTQASSIDGWNVLRWNTTFYWSGGKTEVWINHQAMAVLSSAAIVQISPDGSAWSEEIDLAYASTVTGVSGHNPYAFTVADRQFAIVPRLVTQSMVNFYMFRDLSAVLYLSGTIHIRFKRHAIG